MRHLDCAIEKKLCDLQEAIEIKKMEMQAARTQAGPALVFANLSSALMGRAAGPSTPINQVFGQASEFGQDLLKKVQQNIKERPWETIRQVAVGSFATGLFLSLRRRRQHSSRIKA